jgi:hypothetical protein
MRSIPKGIPPRLRPPGCSSHPDMTTTAASVMWISLIPFVTTVN